MDALAEAVSAYPHAPFTRLHVLVDARESDLGYPSVTALRDLEAFARATHGSLAAVHAAILAGPRADPIPSALLDAAGAAVGLAVLLRAAPAHAASRLSYAPRELVERCHVEHRDLLNGAGNAPQVFEIVAQRAEQLVAEARHLLARVSDRAILPAFWPLYMAQIYLARLKKAQYNPFQERLQSGMQATYPLALQMRLLRARFVGR